MTEKIEIVEMPSHFAAIVKVKTNDETIGDDHKRCFQQVMAYLQKNNLQPAGPPLNFYLKIESDKVWEIGAGFPVATRMEGDDTVEVIEIPAGTVATMLHTGPYDGLEDSWKAFEVWHSAQGYSIDMNSFWCWESFLTDDTVDEAQAQVKLHWMI